MVRQVRTKTLNIQRSVYLTQQMWDELARLATRRGNGCKVNDLIREASRNFLDDQADIIGSRRNFQKSFQSRIDQFETNTTYAYQNLLFYAHVIIQMLALTLAPVVGRLTQKEITSHQLIQKAVIDARKNEAILGAQVQAVRELPTTSQQ
jgi:hypothetical protein